MSLQKFVKFREVWLSSIKLAYSGTICSIVIVAVAVSPYALQCWSWHYPHRARWCTACWWLQWRSSQSLHPPPGRRWSIADSGSCSLASLWLGLSHLRTDKSAEDVKALEHIGRLRPEPISETVIQAKHCPGWCETSPRWNSLSDTSPPRTMSWLQSSSITSGRMPAYVLTSQPALRLPESDRSQTLSEWTFLREVPLQTIDLVCSNMLYGSTPIRLTVVSGESCAHHSNAHLDYLLFRYFQYAFHLDEFSFWRKNSVRNLTNSCSPWLKTWISKFGIFHNTD